MLPVLPTRPSALQGSGISIRLTTWEGKVGVGFWAPHPRRGINRTPTPAPAMPAIHSATKRSIDPAIHFMGVLCHLPLLLPPLSHQTRDPATHQTNSARHARWSGHLAARHQTPLFNPLPTPVGETQDFCTQGGLRRRAVHIQRVKSPHHGVQASPRAAVAGLPHCVEADAYGPSSVARSLRKVVQVLESICSWGASPH
jgi:hypothetical protein